MRWLIIGVAVLTFAFAGVGCGGSDDEASGTETTITDTTSTDETTDETTTESTDTDTSGDVAGAITSGECSELVAVSAALGQAFASQGQGDLGEAQKLFDQYADKVPESLQDDVQVLADANQKYVQALDDAGVDLSDLSSGNPPSAAVAAKLVTAYAAIAKSIDVPAVQQASMNISTWVTAGCPSSG
jgi:hypothetical protein